MLYISLNRDVSMSLHVCANMHIHIKHMCMHNVAAVPTHMYARVCVCAWT